jgi:hypothetical protein
MSAWLVPLAKSARTLTQVNKVYLNGYIGDSFVDGSAEM